ncbi:MAG: hypothetical protein IPK19_01955 [Chloroflexi bacterium]|nr:hypothetical protein [Chloroflexota bacterium]
MMNIPRDQVKIQASYTQTTAALGAAALILGIATAATLLFGDGDPQALLALFATLGVVWLLIVGVIGLNDWRLVRRERRDAEALLAGDSWAEWRWSPEEWRREIEQQRADLEKWKVFQRKWAPVMTGIATVAVAGTLAAIVLIAGDDMPANLRGFMFGLAGFLALLVIALSVGGLQRERRKRERRLERSEAAPAPRIRFGEYGLYHEVDGHTSLRNLHHVTFSAKQNQMAFHIRHEGPAGSSRTHPTHLPVPEAHLDDAPALARRYNRDGPGDRDT